MKNIGLFFLLFISLHSNSQGVFTNNTNAAIERVIQDYPNQFRNIKGQPVLENSQFTNYESSVRIPGALSCLVTKYNFSRKEAMCWKADLLETSGFQDAKTKYKELYNQIRNSIVRIEGEKPYILNGQYESPVEGKRFHSVTFNMLPSMGEMQKLKVELSLTQQAGVWKIGLIIYDQDRKSYDQAIADN
jgi:hypothetical protein